MDEKTSRDWRAIEEQYARAYKHLQEAAAELRFAGSAYGEDIAQYIEQLAPIHNSLQHEARRAALEAILLELEARR